MSGTEILAPLPCGPVRGRVTQEGVHTFLGVPYAAAPVGEQRWRAPAPVVPWKEPRDATKASPLCPQYDMDSVGLYREVPMSEDCLYLNVWTPALDDRRRPVLFYIHGGGFETGGGAGAPYSGDLLAAQHDVVVVTINYRLSIFGFPPFDPHGDAEPTNLGLLDQVAALAWVKENIAALGGDPDRVTLFGLSAGGWSIVSLLGMPAAKGLFHGAVAQSSSALTVLTEQARHLANQAIFTLLKADGATDNRLRQASTEDLIEAAKAANHAWRNAFANLGDRNRVFVPHADSALPDSPMKLAKAKEAFKGPLLIGTVREEVGYNPFRAAVPFLKGYFQKAETVAALTQIADPQRAEDIWHEYTRLRGQSEAQIGGFIRSAFDYIMPSLRFAELRSEVAPTWMYQFLYASPKVATATHASDIQFWSGTLVRPSPLTAFFLGESGATEEAIHLSQVMQRDLVHLASHGSLDWPRYDRQARQTRIYDVHPDVVSDPVRLERQIWEGVEF